MLYISVKVLLNITDFMNTIGKMHDLCKTKVVKKGYKDMNLFLRDKK